jgi:hypothetical protein
MKKPEVENLVALSLKLQKFNRRKENYEARRLAVSKRVSESKVCLYPNIQFIRQWKKVLTRETGESTDSILCKTVPLKVPDVSTE